jgi:hypothetical protein
MDPDVIHDPVFQAMLYKLELNTRKLRDSVIAMRSFYLTHDETPQAEGINDKWRGSILSEEAAARHESLVDAAADLLRYAFEIAPHSSCPLHMEELYKMKAEHRRRLEVRTGWGKPIPHPRGIEEKVQTENGVPLTLVINPSAWEFTAKAKRANAQRKPAIRHQDDIVQPIDEPPPAK